MFLPWLKRTELYCLGSQEPFVSSLCSTQAEKRSRMIWSAENVQCKILPLRLMHLFDLLTWHMCSSIGKWLITRSDSTNSKVKRQTRSTKRAKQTEYFGNVVWNVNMDYWINNEIVFSAEIFSLNTQPCWIFAPYTILAPNQMYLSLIYFHRVA